VIAKLAAMVMNAEKGHTVNLNKPDLAVCVEIIKNVCCLSVVKDLFRLRKYNIHEINKQIILSQSNPNSKSQEEKKANDPSVQKPNDNSQDMPTTNTSHTGEIVRNDTVVHDTVGQDTDAANVLNIITKESQE